MTGFLLRVAIVALGLWLATQILPGLYFESAGTLLGPHCCSASSMRSSDRSPWC